MRPTQVRPVEPADVPRLVALCLQARSESTVGNQVCSSDADTVGRQLGALATAPGGLVLVALAEDEIVGLLLGRVLEANPFTDEGSLVVEVVYVAGHHRRRGIGHALMALAVELGEQRGAAHVYAAPLPGARGMQRFFVQLGFTPAAAHRATSLAALRRRLAQDLPRPALGRRSAKGLEDLIARRRQVRAATGEIPIVRPSMLEAAAAAQDVATRTQVSRPVLTRRPPESRTTIS